MASKKLSTDTSLANSYKLSRGVASVARPSAPTIGTATDGGSGLMSITFTASTLGPTASSFTLTSSSGVTGSGASSPLTLQEVVEGTYTYSVSGVNANGTGPSSAASNSVVVSSVYGSSYESIATYTVGAGGSSADLVFSSIPATYKHLQIRGIYKRTGTEAFSSISVSLNGDTAQNYTRHDMYGVGSGTGGASGLTTGSNTVKVLAYAGASYQFGPTIIDILDYATTTKYKTVRAMGGVDINNVGTGIVALSSGVWINTAAVNSVTLSFGGATAVQHTSFSLYGIKGS